MRNLIQSTTRLAMHFVSQYLTPGMTAVDATCGNGNDTVALAGLGAKKIYAFDIQKAAVERTRAALIREGLYSERIHLIHDSHENMGAHIKEKVQVILFNLGYLPSASKDIATRRESTVKAIRAALCLLQEGGLLCAVMYSGHPGGAEEKQAVLELARSLEPRIYHVAYINMLNQRNHPPEILLITLKRGVEFEKD